MAQEMKGGLPRAVTRKYFSFSGFERDYVGLNQRDGTYLDISGVSGADSITDARGAAFADFDNDGDYDILMTSSPSLMRQRTERPYHLFRNNIGQSSGWLRVALRGTKSGPDAFGAIVRVKTSEGILTKIKSAGHGFMSQSDPRLLFGLGAESEVAWIEVSWPSGLTQKLKAAPRNTSIKIVEGADTFEVVQEPKGALPDPLSEPAMNHLGIVIKPGQSIRDLKVRTRDGAVSTLGAHLSGTKGTIVSFWASWCSSCGRELSQLTRIFREVDATDYAALGVLLDERPDGERLMRFFKRHGVRMKQVNLQPQELGKVFEGKEIAVPLTVIVDGSGTVTRVLPKWDRNVATEISNLVGATLR